MENIFIEFLPPWIETGLQPAFYDKESGTVLQQTARMYAKINELIKSVNDQNATIDEYVEKFNELHDYVYDYFSNLDVQEEINIKLDSMVNDGTLQSLINAFTKPYIDEQIADISQSVNNINELLQQIGDLSPKAAYPTLSALESADPASGIYIVTSNGHIYAWVHGGSATDLGEYQHALNTFTTDVLNSLNWVSVDLGENEFRFSPAVESGVIGGDGDLDPNDKRLTTTNFYRFDNVDIIQAKFGYQVSAGVWNADHEYLGYYSNTQHGSPKWVTELTFEDMRTLYPTADHFKLIMRRSDNGTIELTEGINLVVTLDKLKNSVYYGLSLAQDYITDNSFINGILGPSGAYNANDARMVTEYYVDLRYFDIITTTNNVEFGIFVYGSDYTPIGYLRNVDGTTHGSPTYWTSLNITNLSKDRHYRLYARNVDLSDIDPTTAYANIQLNFKPDISIESYLDVVDNGITITNTPDSSNDIWTEYDGRLAFGMRPNTAPVPTVNNQQFINYGTMILLKGGNGHSMDYNRWNLHVLEAYDSTYYNRITMLVDKHVEYGRKNAELYYYTGADHSNASYGNFKLGSDVRNHSFLMNRDEFIADGLIDAHSVVQLARINPATDIITTYDNYAEADAAYDPENNATSKNNAKCCRYIQLKNAQDGAMFYDTARKKLVVKIDGVWSDVNTTPVPNGTYNF